MAWTTPRTWTTGEQVTKVIMDTHVRDNLLAVYPSGPAATTPSFSAGNFTASGSMTWTVASGDVNTFKYVVVGKTMTVWFQLDTTTVGGTPDTELRIAVPGSATVGGGNYHGTFIYSDNGGAYTAGRWAAQSGGTIIRLIKLPTANWTAATNTTQVFGSCTFEIV